ncbi:hypothetical protein PTTG_05488 [Puccinia triticina 1-1 BBBD Race 1]|uniref:Uncharacterized protein n=1 Tax=Puccinia triticina (isolate 1-1 / race 1 (BBBD)) TaxID=630390 RepID=A0A0C4EXE0_PUCT1|nr:hypothetical protein PTTG_05488 [Puccinia triticina 1-1 BBBD Race 1]
MPRAPRRSTPAAGALAGIPGVTANHQDPVENPVRVIEPAGATSLGSNLPTFAEVVQRPIQAAVPKSGTLQVNPIKDVQVLGSSLHEGADVERNKSEQVPAPTAAPPNVNVPVQEAQFAVDSTSAVMVNVKAKKSKLNVEGKTSKRAVEALPTHDQTAGISKAFPVREDVWTAVDQISDGMTAVKGKKSKLHRQTPSITGFSCKTVNLGNPPDCKVTRAPEAEPSIRPARKLKTKRRAPVITEIEESSDKEIKKIVEDSQAICKVPRSATTSQGPTPKLKTKRQSSDKGNQKNAENARTTPALHPAAIDPPPNGVIFNTVKPG